VAQKGSGEISVVVLFSWILGHHGLFVVRK